MCAFFNLVNLFQACVDAAREQVNTSGIMSSSIAQRMAPPRSAVHRILSRALHPLAAQLTLVFSFNFFF